MKLARSLAWVEMLKLFPPSGHGSVLLSDRFPRAKIVRGSVDEDDWFAGALLDVLQARPIDLNLLGSFGP
jgi:hypothetical protein